MHSQMLYTTRSFEICQEWMFVKQRRTHGWSIYLLSKKILVLKQKSSNLYIIGFNSVTKFLSDCYPHYIRNRSQWNAMWRDNQPHGYSRPILFPNSAKRMRDRRQNHHGCRKNKLWLLWNAFLTTPYVKSNYKYMFLVARDLYEMFVLYRGKHATRSSTVGIWSEVRVYRALIHEYIVGRLSMVGQVPDDRRLKC